MSKTSDTTAPVPPVRPDNDECCHSGCEPCIFDLYELEMEKYRAALTEWEKKHVPKVRTLPRKARRS
ncbi:MAG: oxidoreductase-like domain-containing protein [Burkholderiaceae bacterium]|uniref:oxidoreductase-like domain-containing protein n=1 Tax=Herminiimonas sp. Marseille-P9896 TaxID=2742211 RepID=UPI00158D739A|nr:MULTISPECIES: oxidoreductase-like domain-containing protein [Oxalobacteraceae]MBX9800863.1 oxidoreductase-like domain-containing protein [Burkholderiaceae bacterium]